MTARGGMLSIVALQFQLTLQATQTKTAKQMTDDQLPPRQPSSPSLPQSKSSGSTSKATSRWKRIPRLSSAVVLPALVIVLIVSVALSLLLPDDETPMAGFVAPNQTIEQATAAFRRGRYAEADSLTRSYALAGDPRAQTILGMISQSRDDRVVNTCDATMWFDRAARQGYGPAQTQLATNIQMGRGTRRDIEKAYFWMYTAAHGGDRTAQASLDDLASFIEPFVRSEIERKAIASQPQNEPPTTIIRVPNLPILAGISWVVLRIHAC
jgi:TPR repeat protein